MNCKLTLTFFLVTAPSNPEDKMQVTLTYHKCSFYLFPDDYVPQVQQCGVKDHCNSRQQSGLHLLWQGSCHNCRGLEWVHTSQKLSSSPWHKYRQIIVQLKKSVCIHERQSTELEMCNVLLQHAVDHMINDLPCILTANNQCLVPLVFTHSYFQQHQH
jgi:hypothetical protein